MWIIIPKGFPQYDQSRKAYAKLFRAAYGTKQASRLFGEYRVKVLLELGYVALVHDPCLYHRNDKGQHCYIGAHVDDFPVVSQIPGEFERLAIAFEEFWEITLKSVIDMVVGLKIHRNVNGDTIVFNDI